MRLRGSNLSKVTLIVSCKATTQIHVCCIQLSQNYSNVPSKAKTQLPEYKTARTQNFQNTKIILWAGKKILSKLKKNQKKGEKEKIHMGNEGGKWRNQKPISARP